MSFYVPGLEGDAWKDLFNEWQERVDMSETRKKIEKDAVMKNALETWEEKNKNVIKQFEEWIEGVAIPHYTPGDVFTVVIGEGAGANIHLGKTPLDDFITWLKHYGWNVVIEKSNALSHYYTLILS